MHYSFSLLAVLKLTFVASFFAFTSSIQAQCNLSQSLSVNSSFNLCGTGGSVNLSLTGGTAPYSISLENVFSSVAGNATINSTSVNINLRPGTWQLSVTDANGCQAVTQFSFFASNCQVRQLNCVNGQRQVQFSNNSSSFLPVTVSIGSTGFTLGRGTSTTINLAPGTYNARVSRQGCSTYTLAVGTNACTSSRTVTPSTEAVESIEFTEVTGPTLYQPTNEEEAGKIEVIKTTNNFQTKEEATKLSVYPNPFDKALTLELEQLTGQAILEVFNIQGQLVFTTTIKDNNKTVNLETLKAGSYLVRITNAKGVEIAIQKVVKQ